LSGSTYSAFSPTFTGTGTFTTNNVISIGNVTVNCPGGTTTLVGNITSSGSGSGGSLTLTAGTLNLNNYNAFFLGLVSNNSNVRSIQFGSGFIDFGNSASAEVVTMATVTNFTYTATTGGFRVNNTTGKTFTFGSTAGGSIANAPAIYGTASTGGITFTTNSWCSKLDCGTGTYTGTVTGTVNIGTIILNAGGTYTGLNPNIVTTSTITPAGKTIGALTINTTGTVTLSAALGCSTFTMTAGTINFASFNLTCSSTVSYTSGALNNIGTISCTTWTINSSGSFTLNTGTISASTGFVLSSASSSFVYNGGTLTTPAFTQTNGVVSLGAALTLQATTAYTLTAGTLSLNNFTLTTGRFSSNNTNTRSINFGTGTIVLNHSTAGTTVLDMATATNYSYTGTPNFSSTAAITRTYTFGTTGGSVTNSPNLTLTGSGTQVGTFTTGSWFNTLNFGTTAFSPGATSLKLNGFTLSSGGSFLSFTPTMVGTGTITSNGNATMSTLIIDGVGITTSLGSNFSFVPGFTGSTTLTNGTLNLNGFNLSTDTFISNNANTRSIVFGTNNIILQATISNVVVIDMATATNFTYTGTGGFTADASVTRQYRFGSTAGGTATNGPNVSITGTGIQNPTFTSGGWFNKLDFGTANVVVSGNILNIRSLTLSSGGGFSGFTSLTFVGTGTIISNGNATLPGFTINHTGTTTLSGNLTVTADSTVTLTAGTLNLNNFTLNTGIFSSDNTNLRAITFGTGNIVLASNGGATNLAMATVTNFTLSATTGGFSAAASITRTFTFGSTAGGTSTNSPNLTLTGSGTSVQTLTTGSWFNTLNFGTTAFNPGTTSLNLNGFTLSSGGSFGNLSVTIRGTGTVNGNGKNIGNFVVNQTGATIGTTTFASALTVALWTQTSGNINFAGFNLTAPAVTYTSGQVAGNILTNIGTIACTTWAISSGGTFTLASGTITCSSSFTVNIGCAFNYDGGTLVTNTTFNQAGGIVTLGASLTLASTTTYTLTTGTLNINSFTLTIGTFSSTNANVRTLAMGTGTILLTASSGIVLNMANSTGCTYTGTGGFSANASVLRTFTYGTTGGTSANAPSLTFTSGGTAPTLTTGSYFNKLDFGTTAFTLAATTLNLNGLVLSTSGNFASLTATLLGSGVLNGNTNTTLPGLTITAGAGTTTLTGAFALTATATLTFNSGTINLNGYNLTTGIFSSDNSNTRSIVFGSNNIVLGHTTAGQLVVSMGTTTNFSCTQTPIGGFTTNASVTRSYRFGTTSDSGYGITAPNLFITSGSATQTFDNGSYFNIIDFTGTTSTVAMTSATTVGINTSTLVLASGGTYTGFIPMLTRTQTWVPQFSKQLAGIGVNGAGQTLTLDGTQTYVTNNSFNLASGTLDLGGFDLSVGVFTSSNTRVRSIKFGTNNIILANTTAGVTNLDMANATNFTNTGTGGFTAAADITRTYTFGTTGGSVTNSPNLTLTGSGTSVGTLTSGSYFKTLNFGTTAFDPGTITINISNLILSTTGTYASFTPNMVGAGTINTNGKTIAALGINAPSAVVSLAGVVTTAATATTTLTAGTLNLNGYNLTTGVFSSNNSNDRAITFGSNNIILGTTTPGATNLNMATATGFTNTGTGGFTSASDITRTYTFGTTGGTATNAPNLTLIGIGSAVPTFTTGSYFKTLDFSTTTSTPATATVNIVNVILSSGGTFTSLSLTMVGTSTPNFNGKTIAGFVVNTLGTVTLSAALNCATYTQTAGTINFATFNLTCSGAATYTAGTLSNMSTINCTTWTYSAGITYNINFSGTISASTSVTMTSGTITYTAGTFTTPSFVQGGGTMTLATAWTLPSTTTYTLTLGVLQLNGYDFSIGSFSSSATNNVRSIEFGTNSIVLTGSSLSMNDLRGFSMTGAGSAFGHFNSTLNVNLSISMGIFSGGDPATWPLDFFVKSGGTGTLDIASFSSGSYLRNLNLANASAGVTVNSSSGTNFNVGQNVTLNSGVNASGLSVNMYCSYGGATTGTLVAAGRTMSNLNNAGTGTLSITGGLTVTGTVSSTNGTLSLTSNAYTFNTFTYDTGTTIVKGDAGAGITYSGSSFTLNNTNGISLPGTLFTSFTLSTAFIQTLGNVTLTGTNTWGTSLVYTHTAGTLTLNDNNLSVGTFISSNINTRGIAFGTGNIVLQNATAATVVLDMATQTGLTLTTTTGEFQSLADVTKTYRVGNTAGGNIANAPRLKITGSGTAVQTLTTGSYFNQVDFSSTTFTLPSTTLNIGGLILSATGTYTSLTVTILTSGNINGNGRSLGLINAINYVGTTTLTGNITTPNIITLTQGTLNINGFTLTTPRFVSDNTNTRTLAFGSGTIIINGSTNPVVQVATATNFTCTGTGGFQADASVARTYTYGSTASGSIENAFNVTLTTGASIATFTGGAGTRFGTINFGTTTFNPGAQTLNVRGVVLSAGGTYTTMVVNLLGAGGTLSGNGKTISSLTSNTTGTVTLGSAITTGSWTQTAGDINFATFNLTSSGAIAFTSGTLTNMGTISCTTWTINASGSLTISSGTISASTSFTFTSGTFNCSGASAITTPSFIHTAGTLTLTAALTLSTTSAYFFTAGTITLNGGNLSVGTFSSANTNTRTISFGTNNIILTTTTAAATNVDMAGVTGLTLTATTGGFTAAASVTRTFTFGTTAGSISNAPNLTFTGFGTAIPTLTTGSWFKSLNFGTTAFTLAATTLNLQSITLSGGGTFTNLTATLLSSGTVNGNGKSMGPLTINHAGTTTLSGAFACTTYTQTAGAVDFATFNLTCSSTATYTAGAYTNISTITCTRWIIAAGSTFTLTQGTIAPTINFTLTSGTFNYNGGSLSNVPVFNHLAGTVTLGQALSLATTGTYILVSGTLALNGFDLTTGTFTSDGTGTRSITFGTNNIVLVHPSAGEPNLYMPTVTNFTYTGTGGFTTDASVQRLFAFGSVAGGATFNAPDLTITGSGSASQIISSGSWFKNLSFGTTGGVLNGTSALSLNIGANLTLSSTGTYNNAWHWYSN
jgi:hypothetical protein